MAIKPARFGSVNYFRQLLLGTCLRPCVTERGSSQLRALKAQQWQYRLVGINSTARRQYLVG
jgi:hypothetical protein